MRFDSVDDGREKLDDLAQREQAFLAGVCDRSSDPNDSTDWDEFWRLKESAAKHTEKAADGVADLSPTGPMKGGDAN
jgi:hypothetical protein